MRTPNSNNFQEQRLHDRKMMKFFLEIQAAVVEDIKKVSIKKAIQNESYLKHIKVSTLLKTLQNEQTKPWGGGATIEEVSINEKMKDFEKMIAIAYRGFESVFV